MEEGLKLILSADDRQLQQTIINAVKTTQQGLGKMNQAVNTFGGGVKTFNPVIQQLKGNISGISPVANRAATALASVNKSSGQATQALVNLSRVAQDAPYGFIGIANNLNPLLESFQRLKVSTGSSGAAIKALGSSLMGAGGLGLALGIGSSLVVAFSDELGDLFNTTEKLKDVTQEAAEAVGEEYSKLAIFKDRLNDVNLSQAQRIKVAKEYNKVADEANKIDLTQINNLGLINQKLEAQNRLILQRALSTAATKRLTEQSDKLIEAELSLQSLLNQRGITEKELIENIKAKVDAQKKDAQSAQLLRVGLDGVVNPSLKAAQAAGVYEDSLQAVFNNVVKLRQELDKNVDALKKFITVDGLSTSSAEGVKKAIEALKSFPQALRVTAIPEIVRPQSLQFALSAPEIGGGLIERLNQDGKNASLAFIKGWEALFAKDGLPMPSLNFAKLYPEILSAGNKIKGILEGLGTEVGTGFGEAIAAAVTGGVNFGDVFSGMFSALGGALQEIGKTLITASAAVQAFKKALNALLANPGAALAVGIGLVAIGGVIKNTSARMPRFADGGVVFGPTVGLMGEYPGASANPEVIAPLSKLKDLLGNNSSRMKVDVGGRFELRGRELVALIAREEQSIYRNR